MSDNPAYEPFQIDLYGTHLRILLWWEGCFTLSNLGFPAGKLLVDYAVYLDNTHVIHILKLLVEADRLLAAGYEHHYLTSAKEFVCEALEEIFTYSHFN